MCALRASHSDAHGSWCVAMVLQFTQFTALMAAAKNANLEMCKALLRSGANPLAVDLVRVHSDSTRLERCVGLATLSVSVLRRA